MTYPATAGAGPPSGRSHVPLLSPQRCVPQDTGFSSLLLKVLMQMLQWLDSSGAEAGPLQAQLKLFATQYSSRRKISDGEGRGGDGGQHLPAGVRAVCCSSGCGLVSTDGAVSSGLPALGRHPWGRGQVV